MAKPKKLLPTITGSIGMLFGGLLGAFCSLLLGNELAVIICYAVGAIGGFWIGALFGYRWQASA